MAEAKERIVKTLIYLRGDAGLSRESLVIASETRFGSINLQTG